MRTWDKHGEVGEVGDKGLEGVPPNWKILRTIAVISQQE